MGTHMWHRLPTDVILLILGLHGRRVRDDVTTRRLQSVWRGYRVRVLLGRFRMLRYLQEFRVWNPSASTFLRRAQL